jgi:hypothetical protein
VSDLPTGVAEIRDVIPLRPHAGKCGVLKPWQPACGGCKQKGLKTQKKIAQGKRISRHGRAPPWAAIEKEFKPCRGQRNSRSTIQHSSVRQQNSEIHIVQTAGVK